MKVQIILPEHLRKGSDEALATLCGYVQRRKRRELNRNEKNKAITLFEVEAGGGKVIRSLAGPYKNHNSFNRQ